MSEYQYYEFLALDQPLSETQQNVLRSLSSRAEISATGFKNVYNFGDFRGDPLALMAEYFDMMIYVTNWGTHQLMLRLPRDLVDEEVLKSCCSGEDAAVLYATGQVLVMDLCSHREEWAGWEEGEGLIARLAPVRAELLGGDLRPAYLAWLLAIQDGDLDENSLEPFVPVGLSRLTSAQQALIDYLRLDPDLVAAAAAVETPEKTPERTMADWIAALPSGEKDQLLLALLEERDPHLLPRLKRRYRSECGAQPLLGGSRRRAEGLLELADRLAELRQAEAERQAVEERNRRLDWVAARRKSIWEEVERGIEEKKASGYDQAVVLLADLRDLAVREEALEAFDSRLADLRERHRSKRAFLSRLERISPER